jgi:phosphate transport system substrate-binding protein
VFPLQSSSIAAKMLTIAGSSTVKPIAVAASPSFQKKHPGVQVTIGGGGSSNGVKNAAKGNVAIGMASRKLKDKEKSAYPDLVPTPIGQDGVATIVNKANPLENITTQQVLDIYTGKVQNWKELGGSDSAVNPVGILLHHGTSSVFMKFVGLEAKERGEGTGRVICYWKKSEAESCAVEAKGVDGNQPACASVITDQGAVSFASIGFAQSLADKGAPVKLLQLNGTAPTAQNVVSGEYALSRPLQVVTKGEPSGLAKDFVDHLLSPQGQAIVKEKGYIPVK